MTSAKFIIIRLAKEIYVAPIMARSERESTVDRATQISSDRYPSQISGHTLRLSHNVRPSLFPLDSYKFS